MKKRMAVVLFALALGGCLEDDEEEFWDDGGYDDSPQEETVSFPTLIVENRGEETALLELWYTHDGVQTYREVTLPAGDDFQETYPDLGAVKLMAGRLRDGLLLVQDTFGKADFRGGTLNIEIRP